MWVEIKLCFEAAAVNDLIHYNYIHDNSCDGALYSMQEVVDLTSTNPTMAIRIQICIFMCSHILVGSKVEIIDHA